MPLDFFSKTKLPEFVPEDMEWAVEELKMTGSKDECLRKAYGFLVRKYYGHRFSTYLKLFRVLTKKIDKLWEKDGYLHCTNINYVLRFLLIKSGHFSEDDIRLRWTTIWHISPHQYTQVKTEKSWINIDIWAKTYGIEFGDYAHGFHA